MAETGRQAAGIDSIAFETSCYVLDLALLATARGVDPDKYHLGLGQFQMAVPPPDEDVVTLAARAARRALRETDPAALRCCCLRRSQGLIIPRRQGFMSIVCWGCPNRCRVVELKQACYSATCALQLALPFCASIQIKKCLLIASDVLVMV